MSKLYYELGLTSESSEYFIHTQYSEDSDLNYNLRKQLPKLEQATLVWEFIDTPVTRAIIDAWEAMIRAPHLLMNWHHTSPTELHPDYTNSLLKWEYTNLVPLPGFDFYQLTVDDAELIEVNDFNQFGVLYMDYNSSVVGEKHDRRSGWRWALDNEKIEHLLPGPPKMLAVPSFHANFALREQVAPITTMSAGQKMWMTRKQADLDPLGYVVGDPRCKIGSYRVANLVTDPGDAVRIVSTYKYLCRHSIVSEEVKNSREKTKKS